MNRNNTLTRQLLFCLSFGLLPLLNANTSSLQASKPDAPKNQKKIYQKGWIDFNKNGKKDIIRGIYMKILRNLSTNGWKISLNK